MGAGQFVASTPRLFISPKRHLQQGLRKGVVFCLLEVT